MGGNGYPRDHDARRQRLSAVSQVEIGRSLWMSYRAVACASFPSCGKAGWLGCYAAAILSAGCVSRLIDSFPD